MEFNVVNEIHYVTVIADLMGNTSFILHFY